MGALIQVDVTFQVIVEGRGIRLADAGTLQDGPEHVGDDVLPAQGQGGGGLVGLAGGQKAEGGGGEGARGCRNRGQREGGVDALPAHGIDEG
jgi:hypothetical protein